MVLNEPFGWPHMAAMILTIAGVWLLSRPSVRPPAASDGS
jgi:drug/metabolite transporter (DMT)-like permease